MIFKEKKGIALVAALLILLALSTIGVIAITTTVTDIKISGNLKDIKQAFYLADAGISHAGYLLQQNIANWDAYLTPINTTNLGVGSYRVTISNIGTTVIRKKVVSTGETSTGAEAVIEAIFSRATFSPDNAIITNNNLTISGNPTIAGSNGGVHSNNNLTVSGNPTITQTASASGTTSPSSPSPPYISGAPTVDIPTINPTQFAGYADYQLRSDGKVYKAGSDLPETMIGGRWYGWNYRSGKWTLSGNDTPPPAILYIEGDARVSGNPGSASEPWQTTLIVTGNIELSGNPIIADYKDPSDPIGVQNLLFVAGLELRMSGNVTQTFDGIIAAHGHIEISGNPTFNGYIIAENATGINENRVSGNMTINYNGGLTSPFSSNTVSVLAWRQVNE
ncbi:MAG: PilX N-terminal domain-containing pilus assembly protein [Nitrospirota bacterium]